MCDAQAATDFATQCLPYQAELLRLALRVSQNKDRAKDLVQETFLHAMLAWDRFDGSHVRAWLIRIMTNMFINDYRKRCRHQRITADNADDVRDSMYGRDHEPPLSEALCAGEISDEMQAALARLPNNYLEIVERADLQGHEHKDTAAALGIPAGTVMSRLFRAHQILRAALR